MTASVMTADMSEERAGEIAHMTSAVMETLRGKRTSHGCFSLMWWLITLGDFEPCPTPAEIATSEIAHHFKSTRQVEKLLRECIDLGLIDERKLDDAGWLNIAVGDFHEQAWVGGVNIWLESPEQAAAYERDPEAWSARYVGLRVDEYREWYRLQGLALCGATTKRGELCANPVGQIGIMEQGQGYRWKKLHRQVPCVAHGGRWHRDKTP